jgi:uncharacterized protein (UPF0147 family)
MAIKSALRPESIVRRNPRSVQSAQNFISGGSPLGSSVVASAANKIVGFQRAAVKPVTPDINSIVSTISSNILNQVDNSIRNATNITNRQVDGKIRQVVTNTTNQIQQIRQQQGSQVTQLQTVVQNIRQQTANFTKQLTDNYQKRIKDVDAAKPVGILDKFLDAYKNALGFVNFFGSGKNIKQLRESLKTLKSSFTESFELAKLIRQTILKIVTQLSNLPKASPGVSPGLNLDVDVPGGPLRRTTPRNAKVGRRGVGLLGLGLGAIGGGMAVNALADSDRLQSASQIPTMPVGLIDTFSFIVNKFANAVEEMISGSKTTARQTPSTSAPGGGAPASKPSSSPASPGSPIDPSTISGDTAEQKAFLATVGSTEAGTYNTIVGGEQIPELTKMTIQEVYDMGMKSKLMTGKLPDRFGGRAIKYGADSHAMGRYQFIPQTMMGAMKSAGLNPNDLYSPENQDKMALAFATSIGIDVNRPMTESDYKKAGSSVAWEGMRKISYVEAKKRYDVFLNKAKGTPKVKPDTGMGGLGVDPSMFAPEVRAKLAQDISQPPPSQAKPSIVTLPGLTGGQPQQPSGGGGQVILPPPNAGEDGPTIPMYPSSDSANFLTIYSKIVYNIVDG